jgi:hypothetical protein
MNFDAEMANGLFEELPVLLLKTKKGFRSVHGLRYLTVGYFEVVGG